MKRIWWIFVLVISFFLIGCGHEHQWVEATCTEPRTCSICGETDGVALGHSWVEASCSEAKHCSVCGITEGDPLGHEWDEATCLEAKRCRICGITEGSPLGHDWIEATHTSPKICKRCGETEGEPLLYDIPSGFTDDHEFGEFSRFNSYASENGLGDTMIWLQGSFENVSTIDLTVDMQTYEAFISIFTDQDGNEWLLKIDLDYYTTIEKYTELCNHSLCVLAQYNGYSNVYKMPSIFVEKIFDQVTGNIISPIWFTEV